MCGFISTKHLKTFTVSKEWNASSCTRLPFRNNGAESQRVTILRIWFSKYKLLMRERERERCYRGKDYRGGANRMFKNYDVKAGGRESNMTLKISNPQ